MDKKALIRDILQIVDLESGLFDAAALAKKYGERQLDLEQFLDANGIAQISFSGARLAGDLLEEARRQRQPKVQKK